MKKILSFLFWLSITQKGCFALGLNNQLPEDRQLLRIVYNRGEGGNTYVYCELSVRLRDLQNLLEKTGKINQGAPLFYYVHGDGDGDGFKHLNGDPDKKISELSEEDRHVEGLIKETQHIKSEWDHTKFIANGCFGVNEYSRHYMVYGSYYWMLLWLTILSVSLYVSSRVIIKNLRKKKTKPRGVES